MPVFFPASITFWTNARVDSGPNWRDEVFFGSGYIIGTEIFTSAFGENGVYSFGNPYKQKWYIKQRIQSNLGDTAGIWLVIDGADSYLRVNGSFNPFMSYPDSVNPYFSAYKGLEYMTPASITSREGIVFPVDKGLPWTLEWKMRGHYRADGPRASETYISTAFRVCGMDNTPNIGGSIIGIDCNQYLGTQIGIPDGNWVETLPTSDIDWHVYTLDWDGTTYTLSRDGGVKGTLAGGVAGVIVRGADFIDIGHAGITNNVPAVFTPLEIQYIKITVVADIHENFPNGLTAWPELVNIGVNLYGSYDPWNDFPLPPYDVYPFPGTYTGGNIVRSGRVSNGIDLGSDTCEVVLSLQSPHDMTAKNIWKDWNFLGHEMYPVANIYDGGWNWWNDLGFYGIIEEAEYTIENDELLVTLRGRQRSFISLSKTMVNQSFSTYLGLVGNPGFTDNGKRIDPPIASYVAGSDVISYQSVVSYINILGNTTIGLTEYSTTAIQRVNEANYINQSALSVENEIADDLAAIISTNIPSHTGTSWIYPYTLWETATGHVVNFYNHLSVHSQIILVNYVTSQPVSQIELTFNDSWGNSYVAVYPVNPFPNNGVILTKEAKAIYGANDIAVNNPLHVFHWQKENRHVSEIEVTCIYGVDTAYDIDTTDPDVGEYCTVLDDIFLGIEPTIMWVVNNREITWAGEKATVKYTLGRTTFDKIDWVRKNL